MAVVGNVIISVSLNLQKYIHNQRQVGRWVDVHYYCLPLWWAAIGLMLLGEVGNFSAYGFAPASVVAPLGAACVVSNIIIAVLFLKERLRVEDIFGMCILHIHTYMHIPLLR